MRPSTLVIGFNPGALPEVDLHLFAGRALQTAERQLQLFDEHANTPLHRLVAAGETVISNQVLMDARG